MPSMMRDAGMMTGRTARPTRIASTTTGCLPAGDDIQEPEVREAPHKCHACGSHSRRPLLSAERLAAQPRPKAVGWSGLSGRPIVDSVPPYRRIDFPLGVAVTDMQHEKALQVVLVEVRVQHKEERHVLDDLVNDLLRKEIAIPETPKARA